MTETGKPTGSGTGDQGDVASAQEAVDAGPIDQKAAFKAALDRKKAASQSGAQHLDGDKHVAGDSHAAASKRQFRRKSG